MPYVWQDVYSGGVSHIHLPRGWKTVSEKGLLLDLPIRARTKTRKKEKESVQQYVSTEGEKRMTISTLYNIGDTLLIDGVYRKIVSVHCYYSDNCQTERYYLGNGLWHTIKRKAVRNNAQRRYSPQSLGK